MNTEPVIGMKAIPCQLYHLTDARLSKSLSEYYKKHLKDIFPFRTDELKRTQFCLNLAESLIGDNPNCSIADIGAGRRLFTGMMCEKGYQSVTAVDMRYYEGCEIEQSNFRYKETSIDDLDEAFDYTFCFEVLEHNPLEKLDMYIKKIREHTRKTAVISLPYYEDPIKTKGHCFTLDTEVIKDCFSDSRIYLLYRENGFSYIFFVFDCR